MIILKPSHENNECHELKKEEMLSKASLCFILMDVYQRFNDSSDHVFLLAKMKFTICLIQCNSSSVLNDTFKTIFSMKNETC